MVIQTKWEKWWALSTHNKWLLIYSVVVLLFIGLGLKILNFDRFRKYYSRFINKKSTEPHIADSEVSQIVWSVQNAAEFLPMNLLCLPQALATKYIIGNSEDFKLYIGLNKNQEVGFEFHAWIEGQKGIIIGEHLTTFKPMWVWK